MTKPSQEVEKIEQLLADPWAVDIEKHKPVKNAENYLYGTMQNLFGVWWNKQANEKYRATHPDNF